MNLLRDFVRVKKDDDVPFNEDDRVRLGRMELPRGNLSELVTLDGLQVLRF